MTVNLSIGSLASNNPSITITKINQFGYFYRQKLHSSLFDPLAADQPNLTNNSSFTSIESFNSCSPTQPNHSSSPVKSKPKTKATNRPLRIVNFNCRSLVKKKEPLNHFLDSVKPDIAILTETWFHKDIKSSEYFDHHYLQSPQTRQATH